MIPCAIFQVGRCGSVLCLTLALALSGMRVAQARAATFVRSTVEERMAQSAAAFTGLLATRDVKLVDGVPMTTLVFTGVRWAFGGSSDDEVRITYEGGAVGPYAVIVTGMPNFEPGFSYAVLLDGTLDRWVPFSSGEKGVWQSIVSGHGDELLVSASGSVLLEAASGRIVEKSAFPSDAAAKDIAAMALDYSRPLSSDGFLATAGAVNRAPPSVPRADPGAIVGVGGMQ